MKRLFFVALVLSTGLINCASAASEIKDTAGREKIGVVSASHELTLDGLSAALSTEADKKGARFFKITSVSGKNKLHGTAVVFR
ncbi:DUF1471 domain-containing protein [Enterobacteriaceae bacterium 8376wB9]|nr:DUF1471 domain-containing protein [Enterobacteriaceae bacterium 8376wB9]